MAETLKDVIAKLKAQQNSQAIVKPATVQAKQEVSPVQTDEEEELIDEELETETPTVNQEQKVDPKQAEVQANAQQIMLLQDNGIFRVELLNQMNETNKSLQEINKALVVIAGIMVNDKS